VVLDDLAAARKPLLEASALPGWCYASERFFAAELEHIHRRNWFFVGREEEWAPGEWRAIDTVGGPALVVRDRAGTLRAFANICRHRGSILCEGSAKHARVLVCPYHAWSYGLDGALMGAPDMERSLGFDKAAHALRPVRLESWAGFVFLNCDPAAPSLAEHLGDLPSQLEGYRAEDMVCTWRYDIECRCNWKLLVENALEAYHTGIVHVRTVGAQREALPPTRGNWLNLQVLSDTSVAVLSDAPPFPPIATLSAEAKRGTYFTMILPGTQFACAQDCIWWLAMRPVAADRTALSLGGCFPRATTALPNFAADAGRYYDRWRQVAHEDVGMLERQQRALASPLYRPGRLSWRDTLVHEVHCWVLDRLPEAALTPPSGISG
jgi:phenylpropionate dioxygenase-like ring-hydroxylating dioxygenase large terminal subunit